MVNKIMKCENCKEKLSPFMLKQVDKKDGKLVFEVECVNCRNYNYLSERSYFHVRKDWEMPKIRPINHKLPSELNVMIVAMERCGISWVVRILNLIHRAMFGKDIVFHPEVSPVKATRKRFPILKDWNLVYEVNPLDVLKKDYDRVLIIKRDKETLMKVHEIYLPIDTSEEYRETVRRKDSEMYDKVYGNIINDPRCRTFSMEELNNYTVDTFRELMDFLNFPEEGRPQIIPTAPPERNWELFSSIMDRNQPLGKRLSAMSESFRLTREGFLQQIIESQKIENKYKIKLERILIIGPRIHLGCHLSENLYNTFKELNYNVELLPLEKLGYGTVDGRPFMEHKQAYFLSKVLEKASMKDPELIIIDEPFFYFYNDVSIPVFYAHREFKRPPKVYYPDIAMFWHQGISNYFMNIFAPHWAQQVPKIGVLDIAVDVRRFEPKEKSIKGIVCLAGRENLNACVDMRELTAIGGLYQVIRETKEIQKYCEYYCDKDGGLTDDSFRELLPKCEAIWIHIPASQFVSRRILEAMACKTVCVMKIESVEHEDTLRCMGFVANKHYIKIENLSDIIEYNKDWNYDNYKDMIENAYKIVHEKHTFFNRAQYLVELYQDWAIRNKGVYIQ